MATVTGPPYDPIRPHVSAVRSMCVLAGAPVEADRDPKACVQVVCPFHWRKQVEGTERVKKERKNATVC